MNAHPVKWSEPIVTPSPRAWLHSALNSSIPPIERIRNVTAAAGSNCGHRFRRRANARISGHAAHRATTGWLSA